MSYFLWQLGIQVHSCYLEIKTALKAKWLQVQVAFPLAMETSSEKYTWPNLFPWDATPNKNPGIVSSRWRTVHENPCVHHHCERPRVTQQTSHFQWVLFSTYHMASFVLGMPVKMIALILNLSLNSFTWPCKLMLLGSPCVSYFWQLWFAEKTWVWCCTLGSNPSTNEELWSWPNCFTLVSPLKSFLEVWLKVMW